MSGTCLMCQLFQLPSDDCPAMHACTAFVRPATFPKSACHADAMMFHAKKASHASQSLLMDSCPRMTPP